MPKFQHIDKVLVIGSGPIVIGQAAEFDYSGTQACLTLKEAGCEVILINNNPATIMTDEHVADRVYFEPLTVKNIEAIIKQEKPDGILATVSGQTGLNLIFQLNEQGILEKYDVEPLGTPIEAIAKGEDRELFRDMMEHLKEPIAKNAIVSDLEAARAFMEEVSFPIIVRPAYTLGGSGGGIATNEEQFIKYVSRGLRASPIEQCLIEESIAGWKEIEFEVVCDRKKQAVVVCHMENIDPVGIHTGDSIVVAPIQTLSNDEIEMLRQASLKIVKELGIIGACNVQLAFEPTTKQYIVIEVNPRVSRSSALASKVTGYPIAKIATKLSLGMTLDELAFPKMNTTLATYEPKLNYVVVKFPSWPFDKLKDADRLLGTQMKATGETMAIERTLAASLQKAVRSLELEIDGLQLLALKNWQVDELEEVLVKADDRRFFAILELMRRNVSIERIHELTLIDHYFLNEMNKLITLEQQVKKSWQMDTITKEQLLTLKQAGFTNKGLANAWNCTEQEVKDKLVAWQINPIFERVIAYSNVEDEEAVYYYTTWQAKASQKQAKTKKKVLIIGSGPIRIGQGIEFDYCSVQGVLSLQKQGYETVLINNNPATVSTDYALADRLIFEPITSEDVLLVMEQEGIEQVIVQFGGQTAINLVKDLEEAGVKFFGTTMDTIDQLEDRDRFYQYLQSIEVPHIPGITVHSEAELLEKVAQFEYPILIRPSYVIGGRGMEIIRDDESLQKYITQHVNAQAFPILIDAYYPGKEVEIDAATDGTNIFIPAIFEHIEKAGVHSGDSMAITPPISLSEEMKAKVVDYAARIAKGINFKGIFNIQYVIYNDEVYVLEVNPRASRTVPIISKVTGVNLIDLATKTLLGEKIANLVPNKTLLADNDFYTIKAPVFSTNKLSGVDPLLVPEMKSTGELIAISKQKSESLKKAFLWNETLEKTFQKLDKKEMFVVTDEKEFAKLQTLFANTEMKLINGKDYETLEQMEAWMKKPEAYAVYAPYNDGAIRLRERALELDLLVFTAVETVEAFAQMTNEQLTVKAIDEYQLAYKKEVVLQ